MPATPGTAARMFRALAEANINIAMITTSEIRTSCVVAQEDGMASLQAIHKYFGLGTLFLSLYFFLYSSIELINSSLLVNSLL